jgi:hypothetical protein
MMLHHLDECAERMRKNLANLSSNWMTAEPEQTDAAPSPEKS